MFRDHSSYRTLTENEKGHITIPPKSKIKPKSVNVTKKYPCDICPEFWMSEIDLEVHRKLQHRSHLKEVSRINKNMCLICFRTQSSQVSLLRHLKVNHLYSSPNAKRIERYVFICDACGHLFFNKITLTWHIFRFHSKNVQHNCELCCKIVKDFVGHQKYHAFSCFWTCPICLENTNDQEVEACISKHNYVLRCEICVLDAKSRELYENHLLGHSKRMSNNIDNYDRYFVTSSDCTYTVEKWLTGIKIPPTISICVLCRAICTTTESKRRHITIDHGYVNSPKKVNMCACGDEFFNALLLKHHVWKMKGDHRALNEEEIKEFHWKKLTTSDSEINMEQEKNENSQNDIQEDSVNDIDLFDVSAIRNISEDKDNVDVDHTTLEDQDVKYFNVPELYNDKIDVSHVDATGVNDEIAEVNIDMTVAESNIINVDNDDEVNDNINEIDDEILEVNNDDMAQDKNNINEVIDNVEVNDKNTEIKYIIRQDDDYIIEDKDKIADSDMEVNNDEEVDDCYYVVEVIDSVDGNEDLIELNDIIVEDNESNNQVSDND